MLNNFFYENLYDQLGINSCSTEEEISNALESWKLRIEKGFIQTDEDIKKINRLTQLVADKSYRLHSLILSGGFGWDALDLQLKRIKKIFNSTNVIAQEWIDVLSSLHVVFYNSEFQEFLFETCHLTDKNNPDDKKALNQVIQNFMRFFLELHIHQVESSLTRLEKNKAIEHFKIIDQFPGLDANDLLKAIESSMELFFKYIQSEINKERSVIEKIGSEKSKFGVKANLSKLERDVKENIITVYDMMLNYEFQNKKQYLCEVQNFLQDLIQVMINCETPEKAEFFQAKITIPNEKKPDKKNAPASVPSYGPGIAEMTKEISDLKIKGDIKKARRLFNKFQSKAKSPEEIQTFKQISMDPFYFLNPKIKYNPAKNGFVTLIKTKLAKEDGTSLKVLWFKMGLPLFPVKAFAFDLNGQCLGLVDLPEKYRKIRLLFFVFVFAIFFVMFNNLQNIKTRNPGQDPEKVLSSITTETSKEKRFLYLIDFLKQSQYQNSDAYEEALREVHPLLEYVFQLYISNKKPELFVKEIGNSLLFLNIKERSGLLNFIFPIFNNYLVENRYQPEELIEWSLKMGGYSMGKMILEDQIQFFLKDKSFKGIKVAINTAEKYRIKISKEILNLLITSETLDPSKALILCESFTDIPKKYWEEILMKIWEKDTSLSKYECNVIIEKVGDNLPEFSLDLLSILLDDNKNKVYNWDQVNVSHFTYPAVEKRVKITVCNYLLLIGKQQQALKIAETIPVNPENDQLYFLRIPILYGQEKYDQVVRFIEKKTQISELDVYYQSIYSLSKVKIRAHKEIQQILKSIVRENYVEYIELWKKLNERKRIFRDYINKQLKAKKGKYESMARKIYLMQNEEEARQTKEEFILSEIQNDYNVIQLTLEITKRKHIFDSMKGLVRTYIDSQKADDLRTARDILMGLKNENFDFGVEILLGEVFFYLGKEKGVKERFKELEDICLNKKEFDPLIDLLNAYKNLNFTDEFQKLIKLIYKKCDKQTFLDYTSRVLTDYFEDLDSKLYYLNKIKEKNPQDRAYIILYEIEKIWEENKLGELRRIYDLLVENKDNILALDDLTLLNQLGTHAFYCYRISHKLDALKLAHACFAKFVQIDDTHIGSLNKYYHLTWFNFLETVFPNSNIHLISEFQLSDLWDAIEVRIKDGNKLDVISLIEKNKDFINAKELFVQLLNRSFIVVPPGFFQLLKTKGVLLNFLDEIDASRLDSIKKEAFTAFWDLEKVQHIKYFKEELEHAEDVFRKEMKHSEKDLERYSESILNWIEAVLKNWIFSNEPLKMGFSHLYEKVELSKALKLTLRAKKVSLLIKLLRMALWYDPEKNNIRTMSPSWVIRNAIWSGQALKESDLIALVPEAQDLYECFNPFFHEDYFLILSLQKQFAFDVDDNSKKVIFLESKLSPFPFQKEILSKIVIQD